MRRPRSHTRASRGSCAAALAWLVALGAAPTCAASAIAAEGNTTTAARNAYDRGTAAYDAHDYPRAAAEFLRADTLAPNPIAFQAALDAALLIDDAVLGAELLERAAHRKEDASLSPTLARARAQFKDRTGRIRVSCEAACTTRVDGGPPVDLSSAAFLTVGLHSVAVESGGHVAVQNVDVRANETTTLAPLPEYRATLAPPQPRLPRGVSPAWFYGALGLTAAAGGAAIASAIDTANKHRRFADAGCGVAAAAVCPSYASAGQEAELRTNVLSATAAALGVLTSVVGIWLVRWRATPVTVALSPGGAVASALVRF